MVAKNIIAVLIVIFMIVIIANEVRFFIWPSFGIPEQPSGPNCGEDRYKFDFNIRSRQDFLAAIDELKKIERRGEEVVPGYTVAMWAKSANFTLNDVNERNSGSLLFNQKLYSVRIPGCQSLIFEMSENGYTAVRGCCGI